MEDKDDIAAFKDFVPTAADDQLPDSGPVKQEPAKAAVPPPPPPPPQATPTPVAAPSPKPAVAPPTPAPATSPSGGRVFATPYARTLAAEKGVDLSVCVSGFVFYRG